MSPAKWEQYSSDDMSPLLHAFADRHGSPTNGEKPDVSFDDIIEEMLPELLAVGGRIQSNLAEQDNIMVIFATGTIGAVSHPYGGVRSDGRNTGAVQPITIIASTFTSGTQNEAATVTPLATPRATSTVNPQVLDALYAIKTTPYEHSFLSRMGGFQPPRAPDPIAVDWETRSPWMDLMADVREHYSLMHPGREQPEETIAPITYVSLQPCHLDQIHDLLARTFWEGINVSDSLQYSPEKCTVVATYKQLVVGAALLSSPQETYITYLAVRAGWENAHIATYAPAPTPRG
ncbi:predicted protein [Postia placenta Mad-698-R]|uniref:N-acetyltransferase domain-containing protein n=1 Tax=Postia placenta MAD-698-R-SB12 TaxID=670580 RepID=A0A1X6N6K9_9APHY|nr:hypothetical protein POSPLADRAFT_1137027 [Postia placenta MAD-698-R-SB12]EED85667.1 predicted protein [Postia placenta Mad-698-R]OSX64150.1 hypothetical protein POSPLADRAFT_1137027 [Postia placenta MAD-698-R-SB12]